MKKQSLLFGFILCSFSAFCLAASCPAGSAGKQRYNSGAMEFCDGSNWVSMKGSSVGSCTAGNAGKQRYNSGEYQFCDGSNWYSMKGSSVGSCTAGNAGKQRYASSKMQFCDGNNWYEMIPISCGGAAVGGYCWYLGGMGENCTTVCSSHGGEHPSATLNYAGYLGSTANCTAVLTALSAPGSSPANDGGTGGSDTNRNQGCHTTQVISTWTWFRAMSPTGWTDIGARLACACNN